MDSGGRDDTVPNSCDCLLSASLPCPALPRAGDLPRVNCRRHRLEGGGQREGGVSLPPAPQLPAAWQWLYPLDSALAEGPSGQPPSRGPTSLVRANRWYRSPCCLVSSGPEAPYPTPPYILRYTLRCSPHAVGLARVRHAVVRAPSADSRSCRHQQS